MVDLFRAGCGMFGECVSRASVLILTLTHNVASKKLQIGVPIMIALFLF
jgi:hypothetical protein